MALSPMKYAILIWRLFWTSWCGYFGATSAASLYYGTEHVAIHAICLVIQIVVGCCWIYKSVAWDRDFKW
jgi:hypothetical protein